MALSKNLETAVLVKTFNPAVIDAPHQDVWTGGGPEYRGNTPVQVFASSEDNSYNGTYVINGLNDRWEIETVLVELSGHTPVPISPLLTRVNTGWQVSAGNAANAPIHFHIDPSPVLGVPAPGLLLAHVLSPAFTTHIQKGLFAIPSTHEALLYQFTMRMGASVKYKESLMQVLIFTRDLIPGTEAEPIWAPRILRQGLELRPALGELHASINLAFPLRLPPLSEINIAARSFFDMDPFAVSVTLSGAIVPTG